MAEIKILTKDEGSQDEYFGDLTGGITMSLRKFISQETETENGVKVPKYEILIFPEHPKIKELEESKIGGQVRDEDKRKRIFSPEKSITIKDNSYSAKLEQLKNQNNLMPEEISQ
ncbi:hypothetical protein C1645_835440 [Glomus cerebriforme]|uniref:Uncharacterized protein n=1 Tax=Glomus cerebriforme TaxID=658196 RepID=A0A397SDR9_9GLOM|nr:hypothetical protein C1645_835440 [Glomus cerebriforme]